METDPASAGVKDTSGGTPLVIRLADGTLLSSTTTKPSRRSNKNKSGRAGRKQANGRKVVAAAGGFANDTKAIYAPSDTPMCRVRTTTASDARLKVVDQRLLGLYVSSRQYTWHLGGSASTGYIGGRGV